MHRRRFLETLGLAAALLPTRSLIAQTSSFADYQQQQQGGFENYQAQLNQDFLTYQQTTREAFANYRAQVNQIWGDQQIGSARVLVSYAPDLKTRSIIDFENATLTIEVIDTETPENLGGRIREALLDTATATTRSLHAQDALGQTIERRLASQMQHQQTGQPDNRPVIADLLTGQPQPERQQVAAAVANALPAGQTDQRPAVEPGMRIYRFSLPLNPANISTKADQYRPLVQHYATQEKLDPALVLAIMHSESAFNPLARSHVPAYGLMQIVPTTAGRDASEKVYGQQRLLTPAYLYDGENNIKMGCAYLHLLYYRYLTSIQHPESRLYCTIAAYNTGSGNVARAFTQGRNVSEAAQVINRMNPAQVHKQLVDRLPYQETRHYLQKVVPRYQAYR